MVAQRYQMSLAELLPDLAIGAPWRELVITGLTNDSRRVQPGDLFLACRGQRFDGAAFIPAAAAAGAVAVLTDAVPLPESDLPVIGYPALTPALAELAGRFYRRPAEKLDLVAITGTNGKTSCCQFIAQALALLGEKPALIGTNGYGFYGRLDSASHTTPDAIRLQQLLADLLDQGAEQVVMEVSSHALDQQRVAGLRFRQAVFTNLSRDHLDYHGSMAAYGAAKAQLFQDYGVEQAVINRDDPFGRQLIAQLEPRCRIISYGFDAVPVGDAGSHLQVEWLQQSAAGLEAEISFAGDRGRISSALLGRFNLSNLLATLGVLIGRGYGFQHLLSVLGQLRGVDGRMEAIRLPNQPLVVIDYAHTPDALEKALQALREHCSGRLWCVFGCGGDRDQGKRPLMAAAAEAKADQLVITSDNPRSEDPQRIIADICSGLKPSTAAKVEADRACAIGYALAQAQSSDVVLVAGKGHEDYQEVNGVRTHFSDAEQVRLVLDGGAA